MTSGLKVFGVVHLTRADLLEAITEHLKRKSEKLRKGFVFSFLDESKNTGAEIVFRQKLEIENK